MRRHAANKPALQARGEHEKSAKIPRDAQPHQTPENIWKINRQNKPRTAKVNQPQTVTANRNA